MQKDGMPNTSSPPKTGVTVRLAPEVHERLKRIAETEHRSVSGYLEALVEREVAARDQAERVIRVHVAPELAGRPFGDPDRRPGESDKAYTRRKQTIDTLFRR